MSNDKHEAFLADLAALTAYGFSAAKAAEIALDARRGDELAVLVLDLARAEQ